MKQRYIFNIVQNDYPDFLKYNFIKSIYLNNGCKEKCSFTNMGNLISECF